VSSLILCCETDVIKAISDYAFVTSPYPVVLSIENHCCFEQQMVMAKIMTDILKEKLAPPIAQGKELPSLNELKHKILIKGKRLEASKTIEEPDVDDDDEDEEEELADSKKQQSGKAVDAKKEKDKKSSASSKKVHPDLSAITYLGTGKVKNFLPETSAAIPCDMMASYGELKVPKLMKTSDATNSWIMHNKRHLR
jgi:phosphatidylinositol phospholipase C delta